MYNEKKKLRVGEWFRAIQVCSGVGHAHGHARSTHVHTHTRTCMFTPGIPGPPRRAHLVNLANTWAHTWLSHIPGVPVPLACVSQGLKLCLGIDPTPHHLPAPLPSQAPMALHWASIISCQVLREQNPGESRESTNPGGSNWPGYEVGLPFSGALGHHGLQCWGCPSFACGFWFD